jgi:hypothetical protein
MRSGIVALFLLLGLLGFWSPARAAKTGRVLVVAAPQASRYTGWSLNWCHGGVPEYGDGFPCDDGTLSMFGDIHAVRLADVQVLLGALPHGVRRIGLPQHALLAPWYSDWPWLLVLEPSPPDFAAATGLRYIAFDDGSFRDGHACLQRGSIGEEFGIDDPTTGDPHCYSMEMLVRLAKTTQHRR